MPNRHLIRALGNAIGQGTRSNGRVMVINYHRVLAKPDPYMSSEPDVATFTWHMELLARCFNVLPLQEALDAIDAGRVPPRAVCITFDDGYQSIHDLALPVLRRLNLTATVFVSSGFVGEQTMWNDRIIEAAQSLPLEQLDLNEFGLGVYPLRSIGERTTTAVRVIEASKYLPPWQRSSLVARLESMLEPRGPGGPMLTPEALVNLDRHGIEIGAHTVTHPILTSLSDDNAMHEIVEGKRKLESIIKKDVRLFAYPNGKVGKDYDARHVAMVRQAGFRAAFTTAVGTITARHDRFQLPRSRPWDTNPTRFALRLLYWLARG